VGTNKCAKINSSGAKLLNLHPRYCKIAKP